MSQATKRFHGEVTAVGPRFLVSEVVNVFVLLLACFIALKLPLVEYQMRNFLVSRPKKFTP